MFGSGRRQGTGHDLVAWVADTAVARHGGVGECMRAGVRAKMRGESSQSLAQVRVGPGPIRVRCGAKFSLEILKKPS